MVREIGVDELIQNTNVTYYEIVRNQFSCIFHFQISSWNFSCNKLQLVLYLDFDWSKVFFLHSVKFRNRADSWIGLEISFYTVLFQLLSNHSFNSLTNAQLTKFQIRIFFIFFIFLVSHRAAERQFIVAVEENKAHHWIFHGDCAIKRGLGFVSLSNIWSVGWWSRCTHVEKSSI